MSLFQWYYVELKICNLFRANNIFMNNNAIGLNNYRESPVIILSPTVQHWFYG